MKDFSMRLLILICIFSLGTSACVAQSTEPFLVFKPAPSQKKEKKIVFISGDEEYRSEESLPMLAQILSKTHGFESVVLFSIHPENGQVDPNYSRHIPGLEQLESADLLIIATRFRELPDAQMKYIDAYLMAGKPVIGLRTATHAFNFGKDSKSAYTRYGYSSNEKGWEGGFGKLVLGETWVAHHGIHGSEGTRGLVDGMNQLQEHPILKGVKDVWGSTDVYTVNNLPESASVLLWGQSTMGMTDKSPLSWEKSVMPIAWTKPYQLPSGKEGKVFTTTMGAATDFLSEDLRRMLVNACYWALDIQEPSKAGAQVDVVGEYNPTAFGFDGFQRGKYPSQFIN